MNTDTPSWAPTACILCSENCGIEVQLEDGHLTRVRGDKAHPDSQGYLCQKAARLDHYQNHTDRLNSPLRRRPGGTYEEIDWDTAIREIADRALALKAAHGGRAFAYYGGGGQGNHLGGVYSGALRAALGTPYLYTALAQEKTGDFWVNGRLFGKQTCHVTADVANAEVVLFCGTNPWQAHGFPRARKVLKEIQADPSRTMIVIDPRRTETADLADVFLQVRPGTDAFLLAALLAVLVREELVDTEFVKQHTTGYEEVEQALRSIPIADFAQRAGVELEQIEAVARVMGAAKSAAVRVDLGVQQSRNSTLNSYLEKLVFLLTGNFAKAGGNNLHTQFVPLIGHSPAASEVPADSLTAVTKTPPISKLYPPNVLPLEVNNDHPERLRALFVDSANPLVSAADTQAYEEAFERLELSVVIDVALTETARCAHYVLPASSQLEKAEATFFTLGFPDNTFHLRHPILPPLEGTLPEPEIYRRLLVAMGALPERFPVLERVARLDRKRPSLRLFPTALKATLATRPRLQAVASLVLYETLGKALPDRLAAAAVLWPSALHYASKHPEAVKRAGIKDEGAGLGEALFAKILESDRGLVLSEHEHQDVWSMIRHQSGHV
ncbi:MAG: molybdopterin-dependent oxidoreductase, partial [Planctomycetota bacterium]